MDTSYTVRRNRHVPNDKNICNLVICNKTRMIQFANFIGYRLSFDDGNIGPEVFLVLFINNIEFAKHTSQ